MNGAWVDVSYHPEWQGDREPPIEQKTARGKLAAGRTYCTSDAYALRSRQPWNNGLVCSELGTGKFSSVP